MRRFTTKHVALCAMRERFAGPGADSEGATPAEFRAYFQGDIAKWSKVVRAAKISAE